MKGALVWFSGAAAAFFLTAGAFLLLANLGSDVSESSLPPKSSTPVPESPLQLNLREGHLATLKPLPEQTFYLEISNASPEDFSNVNLTLRVLPTNTALSETRYYQVNVDDLEAGESETVEFRANLSPPDDPRRDGNSSGNPERIVMEIQATTPEGISAVKTAILTF